MPKRARQLTFTDARLDRGRGGPRTGAGRPRVYARPPVHHVRRLRVPRHCPSHVTLRVRQGVPSLRTKRFLKAFRSSLRESSERGNFRVVHYSLQRDHVHLLVEAAGKRALADGMKSISPRLARCVHRVYGRRGPVLFGRYHIKALRTPLEVHRALRYVLLNTRRHWKKRHGQAPAVVRLDEASSGRWFDGWTRLFQSLPAPPERETASPRTWLLSEGWRRHGRIDPAAVPGPA